MVGKVVHLKEILFFRILSRFKTTFGVTLSLEINAPLKYECLHLNERHF